MKVIVLKIISIYKWFSKYSSPYKTCVFEPTCSEYAETSIRRFGLINGAFMGLRRIGRCHPWQKNKGWDPVPDKKTNH